MDKLPVPPKESVFYEDSKVYACLAENPMARGHAVVVWKEDVEDLRMLSRSDFEYLMDVVDRVRNAMLKALRIEKIYLLYMDEVRHVHWHLVPRYRKEGMDAFHDASAKPGDFSLAPELKDFL